MVQVLRNCNSCTTRASQGMQLGSGASQPLHLKEESFKGLAMKISSAFGNKAWWLHNMLPLGTWQSHTRLDPADLTSANEDIYHDAL